MKKQIFVSGLSNSLMRAGYADGLAAQLGAQLINKSLGASNCGLGIWQSIWFREQMESSDIVIFEYFIMDYQTDLVFIRRDLPILLGDKTIRSKAVVLLWPDKTNLLTPVHVAIDAYIEACNDAGVPLINGLNFFKEFMQAKALISIDDLFSDVAHVHRELAFEMGQMLAPILGDMARPEPPANSGRYGTVSIQQLSSSEDRLAGPPDFRLPMTTELTFTAAHDGVLIGLMIEARHRHFTINIKGRERLVWTYWDPNNLNPPAVTRFVSVPSTPIKRGELLEIEARASDDKLGECMAIHSLLISNE